MSNKQLKDLEEKERKQLIKEIQIYSDAVTDKVMEIASKFGLKVKAEILLKDIET